MMTPAAPTPRRLQDLLDQVLDGASTPEQNRELNALVEQRPELAREIAAQLRLHSLLEWESPEVRVFEPPAEAVSSEPTAGGRPVASVRATGRRRWLVAAVLAATCGGALWWVQTGRQPTDPVVAEIVDENLVDWSSRTDALTDDRRIAPGLIAFESGSLTLRFRSGATVKATGPASMRIESDMLVRLDRGQATAHVPRWAVGFTIETPDVEIVDQGTEFGVVARGDGKTDVVVFDGEVDLTPVTQRTPRGPKRLTQGEAVSVSQGGSIDRIMQVRRDNRGESWSTAPSREPEGVISGIRDNLRPSDSPKYYQITPTGLAEDALAYVDRPHQWNGLNGVGLPEFLRQVDYVRPFNDDKYLGELEIVVELSQPAWLYVLFDDRVPLPQWLQRDFEDTGVDIGLDEGPWEFADPTLRTAIGSGNSIDRTFSVWRKKCETPQAVRLGSMGVSLEARAMYGIAARPLD
jgi:hypothetical protein